MKSHEVDVDILLECEEGPGDGVGHAARALDFLGGETDATNCLLDAGDLVSQERHALEGEDSRPCGALLRRCRNRSRGGGRQIQENAAAGRCS